MAAKKATSVKKSTKKQAAKKPVKDTWNRKMNPVVHFEMPFDDRKRMAKFYNKAFGWETTMLGEEMGNYVLAKTGDTDKKGMMKQKGMINGGFYQKDPNMDTHPSLVLAVENIKQSMKKIEKAGGKILGEPMEIPDYGTYVSFIDSEGNRNGLMQPVMM